MDHNPDSPREAKGSAGLFNALWKPGGLILLLAVFAVSGFFAAWEFRTLLPEGWISPDVAMTGFAGLYAFIFSGVVLLPIGLLSLIHWTKEITPWLRNTLTILLSWGITLIAAWTLREQLGLQSLLGDDLTIAHYAVLSLATVIVATVAGFALVALISGTTALKDLPRQVFNGLRNHPECWLWLAGYFCLGGALWHWYSSSLWPFDGIEEANKLSFIGLWLIYSVVALLLLVLFALPAGKRFREITAKLFHDVVEGVQKIFSAIGDLLVNIITNSLEYFEKSLGVFWIWLCHTCVRLRDWTVRISGLHGSTLVMVLVYAVVFAATGITLRALEAYAWYGSLTTSLTWYEYWAAYTVAFALSVFLGWFVLRPLWLLISGPVIALYHFIRDRYQERKEIRKLEKTDMEELRKQSFLQRLKRRLELPETPHAPMATLFLFIAMVLSAAAFWNGWITEFVDDSQPWYQQQIYPVLLAVVSGLFGFVAWFYLFQVFLFRPSNWWGFFPKAFKVTLASVMMVPAIALISTWLSVVGVGAKDALQQHTMSYLDTLEATAKSIDDYRLAQQGLGPALMTFHAQFKHGEEMELQRGLCTGSAGKGQVATAFASAASTLSAAMKAVESAQIAHQGGTTEINRMIREVRDEIENPAGDSGSFRDRQAAMLEKLQTITNRLNAMAQADPLVAVNAAASSLDNLIAMRASDNAAFAVKQAACYEQISETAVAAKTKMLEFIAPLEDAERVEVPRYRNISPARAVVDYAQEIPTAWGIIAAMDFIGPLFIAILLWMTRQPPQPLDGSGSGGSSKQHRHSTGTVDRRQEPTFDQPETNPADADNSSLKAPSIKVNPEDRL